jgi:hypothetical protein
MASTAIVPVGKPEVIKPSALDKAIATAGAGTSIFMRIPFFGRLKRGMSRRDFENRMSRYVNSALGHESEGLDAGSDEYKRLYSMANTDIDQYCNEWNVNRPDLEAQIPSIRKLRNLATSPEERKPKVTPGQIIGGFILLAIVLWVAGAATGLFRRTHVRPASSCEVNIPCPN